MKIDSRRRNREAVTRIFQGIVDDFGNTAGEKIIRHIVDQAGGIRMRVPSYDIKVNQFLVIHGDPLCTNSTCFRRLWRSTCKEFGQASGHAIMQKIFVELGGQRVLMPDHKTLSKIERNRKVRYLYDGTNRGELALRFALSKNQIRKIVNDTQGSTP